jgi:ubiquinone/menaquinone biosynthesis C-methylase UbiE
MKPQSDFWKNWWNEQARHASSDYALNRRTSLRLENLEQKSHQQFMSAVNPQPGDMILDAGCGSGRNISIIAPLVKEIVGIDYSDQMIERAREKVSSENLHNVRLIQGDITSLQFPSNSFDKVICASVLQYLDAEDCAKALFEMARVCKPGGTLVVHAKNGTSLYGASLKLLRPLARLLGKQMKPEFYRSRSWHEKTLAKASGFVSDFDGFGILTFVPLPQRIVGFLLNCELALPVPKFLKKFAVNYKMTVLVDKSNTARRA